MFPEPTPEHGIPSSRRALLGAGAGALAAWVAGAVAGPARTLATHLPGFGHANNAGSANTTLATNSTGTALLVQQNGSGTALRGQADQGIAGFFTSVNGSGVSGVVAANNKYGVYGGNDAATFGGGAAMRADGKQNHGIVATTAHDTANAVRAIQVASTGGTAIFGQALDGVGVQGVGGGSGVRGISASGTGVSGESVDGTGARGESTSGMGIVGTSGSNIGVRGLSDSHNAIVGTSGSADGVQGHSDGLGHGVFGSSLEGIGVGGYAIAANASGVYGQSAAGDGVVGLTVTAGKAGVYGQHLAAGGYGLYGNNGSLTGTTYGVYGHVESSDGYAGYFEGNAHVTGTLTKGAGAFKIDHPLDPANRYLSHSFVESPDMMNIYNGNATTDASGEAVVDLPAWFEALNRDYRYQLTVIGGFAQAAVAREIVKGRFTIATDKPNVKVSWQVTGVRHDPFAEAHRIPVDEAKPADERGTYLHPVERGVAASKGLSMRHVRPESSLLPEPRPVPQPRLP